MRIGCLQFAPQVGDVSNNLNRADAVLAKADPMALDNLDLLVLPEMAFSGYNFKSLEEIMPYLEPSGSGISSLWARTTALKYDCTVAVGYPEKAHNARKAAQEHYNSLIMVNGDGETIGNYRKTFLYYTDATWAQEGDGFYSGQVEDLGQVAAGICMDINPYKFEAPWHAFEFAFHILEVKANLVIMSMAWLTREHRSTFTPFPHDPDMETMTYWVQRLEPVIRSENQEEIIVVFCNRCGIEDDVVYAGTSAVLGVKNGEVSVYGLLGRGVKELLIVNTDLPPFAKLVNRPEGTPTSASVSLSPKSEATSEKESIAASAPISVFDPTSVSPAKIATPPPARRVRSRSRSTKPERGSLARASSPKCAPEPKVTKQEAIQPPSPTEDKAIPPPEEKSPSWKGCEGGCGGCEEHDVTGKNNDLTTPTCPSPTPMSVRPKLAISTGPETLPPVNTRPPPSGMEPGNFFTSRDLCTPPITPFDDVPMSTTRYHWNAPTSAYPASAKMHTPEEPVWPTFNGSTKIDFKRTPSRAPPTRPDSRAESRAESRPASRVASRPASRQSSRTREVKAEIKAEVKATGVKATEDKAAEALLDGLISVTMVPERPVSPKSRNVSPTREQPESPTSSHRSFRSDPGRHMKRTKSLDNVRQSVGELSSAARSRKDGKQDLIRRIEELRSDKSSRDKETVSAIPIAASPSVFNTSFSQRAAPASAAPSHPRASERSRSRTAESVITTTIKRAESQSAADRRARSKSVSNTIPMFQYQGPAIPQSPLVASFGRNVSRGRQPMLATKRSGSDLITSPSEYRSNSKRASSKNATATTMMHHSVHPDIQALLITEDEAFGYEPRPASRAESRGRRRTPGARRTSTSRRRHSTEREKDLVSPQDMMSPVSV
ncbi:carbon-nitrogen hydrolase [Apodospora peruviana]|uniref:Carbon-nitrogen hydrolase n=1 Tax=Apodospora peruviana TaxID=516989 RepID=A0AAE0IKB5_9PEZI|nr:carbon-nitrogen hydrolase [Apodospora peruviana]